MSGKRKACWEPGHAGEGRMAAPGSTSRWRLQAQVGAHRCLKTFGTAEGRASCSESPGLVEELEEVRGTRHSGEAPPHPLT